MSTTPIRLDRVQAGLYASVAAALPVGAGVAWYPAELPLGVAGDPLAVLQVVTGFDSSPSGGEARPPRRMPAGATVTLTGAGSVRLHVSGMWWEAASRDALIAALAAEPLHDLTVAASGADAITLTPTAIGDLHSLDVAGPATATITSTEFAEVEVAVVTGSISVDLYSTGRYLRDGAQSFLQRWRAAVKTTAGRELLDRYGLTLGGAPIRIQPLDGLAGERWSSRARAVVELSTLSVFATTTTPPIEAVTMTLDFREPALGPLTTLPIEITT